MVEPKAYYKGQLRRAYGVCWETFYNWLKKIEEKTGNLKGKRRLTPATVKIIFDNLGEPDHPDELK